MATPEEDNHAAKKEANGKLDELNDKLDNLKSDDVDPKGLPPQGSNTEEQLENFKGNVETLIDKAQEAINAYHISEADEFLREARKYIRGTVTNGPIKQEMLDLIKAARKAKRKITAPRLGLASVRPPNSEQHFFVSAEDILRLSARDILETSLSNLDLSSDRLKLVQSFGLHTVGDLVDWRKSKS